MPDSIGRPPVYAASEHVTKTALGRRFIAALIDGMIVLVLIMIPYVGGVIATAYWLCRDGVALDFMDRRSIGKTVMKLRPVRMDGREMDVTASARRNWMFAIGATPWIIGYVPFVGIEVVLLVILLGIGLSIVEGLRVIIGSDGRRFGDNFARTHVIETID